MAKFGIKTFDDASQEMNDHTGEFLFGDAHIKKCWPHARSKEISISILVALRANIPQNIHMQGALNVGLTRKG